MIINGTRYIEIPVKTPSCHGCDLYENKRYGKCLAPQVDCVGLNREDGLNVIFRRNKDGLRNAD